VLYSRALALKQYSFAASCPKIPQASARMRAGTANTQEEICASTIRPFMVGTMRRMSSATAAPTANRWKKIWKEEEEEEEEPVLVEEDDELVCRRHARLWHHLRPITPSGGGQGAPPKKKASC